MNHARFVPLPSTVIKDEETGTYHQNIDLLDAPLYFVPRKYKQKEPEAIKEDQGIMIEQDVLAKPEDLVLKDADIDVDDSDNEEETATLTSQSSMTRQSSEFDLLDKGSDELELDVEGDDDVMDYVQPWKMRLHDEKIRKQLVGNSQAKPTQIPPQVDKRNRSPSSPLQEDTPQPKKKKKSLRFA